MNAQTIAATANSLSGVITFRNTNLATALATCGAPPLPHKGGMVVIIEPGTSRATPEVQAAFSFTADSFKHPYPSRTLKIIRDLRAAGRAIPPDIYQRFFDEWENGTSTAAELKARFESDTYQQEHPNDPICFLRQFCDARAAVQKLIMELKNSGHALVRSEAVDAQGRQVHRYELPKTTRQ